MQKKREQGDLTCKDKKLKSAKKKDRRTVTLPWCVYQITTTTITLMVRLSNNHNDNNFYGTIIK